MRCAWPGIAAAVLFGIACPAAAQDELGLDGETIEVADERPPAWRPSYEALLRSDRVTGLPGGREDLERVRSRVRAAVEWNPDRRERWIFGAAVEAGIGTGANSRSLANNDVEDVDGAGLDQLWMRRRFSGASVAGQVEIGKNRLPFALTPMVWDDDLRPFGVHAALDGSFRDFDRWRVLVGAFEPDPLDVKGPRFSALTLAWETPLFGEGTFGVQLAHLDWSGLGKYARNGLARGNSFLPRSNRYALDYRLLDAQVFVRTPFAGKSLEARLDRVTNLEAERDDEGTRASLVWGDRFDPDQAGWELGWSWQRIQRDAVLAAVNADDWWFHTAARGHMPWVGFGFGDGVWSLRVAGFFETRDGLEERTRRLLVDLEARW